MKFIIKNDSKETVKNPNIKIIETTEASFANQVVILENNDVPIIKYTDTESMYFVKDLDNLYDRKSRSEVLLNITIDNLEAIGGGNSEPVDSRPYKVYTALLNQSGTGAPTIVIQEDTITGITVTYQGEGSYYIEKPGAFIENRTYYNITQKRPFSEFYIYRNDDNIIEINTFNSGVNVDGALSNTPIEIRVYN